VYVFMPLDDDVALQPAEDALRVTSEIQSSGQPLPKPQPERRMPIMPSPPPAEQPHRNGDARKQIPPLQTESPERSFDPLAEAEVLRELLHDAQGRLGRLLMALKQQRRQSRAVQAAMQSLRRLKLDGTPGTS
jgi:hypothetical protein